MEFRVLIPSYLDSNHRNTLRFELCEILYSDYKKTTFFLEQQLVKKKEVLNKSYDFLKKHPEISKYKENSQYWYPYENVDGDKNLSLYEHYYPNTDDEITYFCQKGGNAFDNYDYLFDPVKLQFFLMCTDIKKMDCNSPTAKEIIKINNELFKILFDKIGDTVSYNEMTTLEHIQKYVQDSIDGEIQAKNDPTHSKDYRDMLLIDYRRFNDFSYLIDEAIIICNENKLQKDLPINTEQIKMKKKI